MYWQDENLLVDNETGPKSTEEETSRSWWRVQYSLRTLLLVMTGACVFCGLSAWLGAFFWLWICGAIGAFVGMIIGICLGVDTQIDDVRWEIAKCLLASMLLLGPAWLMISAGISGHGRALLAPVIIAGFLMKLIWPDYDRPEIVLVLVAMLLGISVGAVGIAAMQGV